MGGATLLEMVILGIETSCDETAASVVKDGNELLSNVVFSSMDLHKVYGGVVPEIAARSHIESITPVINLAITQAFQGLTLEQGWKRIDGIAVTYGAGLGGSLLVGVMTARTLAIAKNKPLYAINHVEAHVYANFLTKISGLKVESKKLKVTGPSPFTLHPSPSTWQLGDQTYVLPSEQPKFPLLALIVSGGHTQLVLFQDHFKYEILGRKRDDAIGEAFDKVAKIIGLPYPGGPSIAKAALKGNPNAYILPKARLEGEDKVLKALREKYEVRSTRLGQKTSHSVPRTSYEFSFSGLKTAVLRLAQKEIGEDFTFPSIKVAERLSDTQKADIAASFQRIAIETVVDKTVLAYEEFQPKSVVIAGGVAANLELRRQLKDRLDSLTLLSTPLTLSPIYTDIKLCTDNGAMIATLGCFKAMLNQPIADPYALGINPSLSM